MADDDRELILEAKKHPAAFSALYKKYQRAVFRFFWYRLHDVELASDFAQDTFLKAFRSMKKFRLRGYSYLTFLLKIARNVLIDHFRRPQTVSLEQAERLPDPKAEEMDTRIDIKRMWEYAEHLSPSDQQVLDEFYRQRRPIHEIAEDLGRSPNAVKLQLSRARIKLRVLANGQSRKKR